MERFASIAERYLKVSSRSGLEWMCRCPFHGPDNTPSLSFNVRRGLWYCHACHEGGDAEKLVKKMGDKWIDPESSLEVLNVQIQAIMNSGVPRDHFLPERILRRYDFPHPKWIQRGFDEDTVEWWDLGFDPVTDRLTIPVRDEQGRLRAIIFRRLDNKFPRYTNPRNFPRNKALFGSWKLASGRHSKSVVLVEGPLDCIRVWQAGFPCVACFGSTLTRGQSKLLRQLGVQEVTLCFDYDDAGIKATQEAKKLLKGFSIRVVDWKKARVRWKTDPGGLSPKRLARILSVAPREGA